MFNSVVVILFGIIIGSFLNVCIYRIPKGESIVYPGSHCKTCKHPLNRLDLVPVLSFLFLKGRCRYCNQKIPSRYMAIELLTGLLYGVVYLKFGLSLELIMYATFIALLIVLTMIDSDHMLLPTKIILFGAGLGIVFRSVQAVLYHDVRFFIYPIVAAFIGYGLFYVTFYLAKLLLKKEGLGFGDVRLIGMLAIYLSVRLTFLTIFLASILASLYGLVLLYIKKKSEPFPFGPFINMGAIIALFYGESILIWYLRLAGL